MTRAAGKRMTEPTPSGVIARLKATVIARYKLVNVPGRPEELRLPGSDRGVSIQYGTFQIRVRLMDGRKWLASFDLQVDLPDREIRNRVVRVLDQWLAPVVAGRPVTGNRGQRAIRGILDEVHGEPGPEIGQLPPGGIVLQREDDLMPAILETLRQGYGEIREAGL